MGEQNQIIISTSIKGCYIIKRPTFGDERGFFHEVFRKSELDEALGFEFKIVQSNHSRSTKGVLRGIHVATWSKLVTAMSGKVQQVVIDLRPDSETFGKHESFILGEDGDQFSVFVPANCGNSFMALTEIADYNYLVDDYWAPGKEIGIAPNDPDLMIEWMVEEPILSEKDKQNKRVREVYPEKF